MLTDHKYFDFRLFPDKTRHAFPKKSKNSV